MTRYSRQTLPYTFYCSITLSNVSSQLVLLEMLVEFYKMTDAMHNARLKFIPGGPQLVLMEKLKLVNQLIVSFLKND